MVSEEYKQKLEQFKVEMKEIKQSLPVNWVQLLLKGKRLGVKKRKKVSNMVVNWMMGRSYKSTLEHPELLQEIKDMSIKYKELKL